MIEKFDVAVVGSGMAGLTAACLLTHAGKKVMVLEQNYLPGGCTSSYWRKGFVFESGATTLVGLQEGMPLAYLLKKIDVKVESVTLPIPMRVVLADGTTLTRHNDLATWIKTCEHIFGAKNQYQFWYFCKSVSDFVWRTSLIQTYFPPATLYDYLQCLANVSTDQLRYAPFAFQSVKTLLKRFDLLDNKPFIDFLNEQLLITAQNHIEEVNILFGATALCYTLYDNSYINGGLINLVNPLVNYLQTHYSEVRLRQNVTAVIPQDKIYHIEIAKHSPIEARQVVMAIPLNNTIEIFKGNIRADMLKGVMPSEKLNSAFQMGIAFKSHTTPDCLHYQLHLPEKFKKIIGSASIFVSLSHPEDTTRADERGITVASVSTHVYHPQKNIVDKEAISASIIQFLIENKFFEKEDVIYYHASTPEAWEKWTRRKWGFVGGYPQYMSVKPWQMNEHRLDKKGAYLCGDSTYPGQGIPGATLSGIIAAQKLLADE